MGYFFMGSYPALLPSIWQWLCPSKMTCLAGQPLHRFSSHWALGTSFIHFPPLSTTPPHPLPLSWGYKPLPALPSLWYLAS